MTAPRSAGPGSGSRLRGHSGRSAVAESLPAPWCERQGPVLAGQRASGPPCLQPASRAARPRRPPLRSFGCPPPARTHGASGQAGRAGDRAREESVRFAVAGLCLPESVSFATNPQWFCFVAGGCFAPRCECGSQGPPVVEGGRRVPPVTSTHAVPSLSRACSGLDTVGAP